MQFKNNSPIYTQLVDMIYEKILTGEWKEGDRVPSVREFGERVSVNPNTVLRAYDQLQTENIIEMKRGIGYFLLEDARGKVLEKQKFTFIKNEIPKLKKQLNNLGISMKELKELLKE